MMKSKYVLIQAEILTNVALFLPVFKVLLLYVTLEILHCTAMCSLDSLQQSKLHSLWLEPENFLVLPDGIVFTPNTEMNL